MKCPECGSTDLNGYLTGSISFHQVDDGEFDYDDQWSEDPEKAHFECQACNCEFTDWLIENKE